MLPARSWLSKWQSLRAVLLTLCALPCLACQNLDVDATTKLYDTENVRLLGTVDTEDNKLRNNHGLIHEYFVHFLSNDKVSPASSCFLRHEFMSVHERCFACALKWAGVAICWLQMGLPCSGQRANATLTHVVGAEQIVAKFPEVTEDNIIQLGPNHVIFSDYYTFELTKDGECLALSASVMPSPCGAWKLLWLRHLSHHSTAAPSLCIPFIRRVILIPPLHGAYFNVTSP